MAEAPALTGDSVAFVALPDGTLVVDEDEPDDSLAPLADAIETSIRPPYRAEGVRQGRARWSVGAVRITVVEAPGVDGEEAELVTNAESSTLTIDGRPVYGSVPAFERAGEAHGSTYVVAQSGSTASSGRSRRCLCRRWPLQAQTLQGSDFPAFAARSV